jgi:lipopolysaccharide export system permease protein
MLILDRYLLRQFLQIFAICFCSLAGLYIVIDAFGNLDDFIKATSEHGSLWKIMGEYYGYRTIGFFDRTSGILTLIAAMFTIATFQRFNELTALQAAGIPKWRVVKPVIAAVIVIASLAALNREIVISALRDRFSRNAQDLYGESAHDMESRTDNRTDIILRGKQTFANQQRIDKPAFALPRNLQDYGTQLIAANGYFEEANDQHPAGYLLVGVSQPKSLKDRPSLKVGDEPVILMPQDNPWLDLAKAECFVVSDVTFEHLASAADWRQNASLVDLIASLRNPSLNFGADMRVAIHARMVQPALDITLLFLGLPLVLRRNNRNMFVAIGLCVVVITVFYLVVLGCQSLGSSYMISPALAAWLPLIIFVPAAMAMSQPLRE